MLLQVCDVFQQKKHFFVKGTGFMAWAGPAVGVLTLDLIQNMKKCEHFFIE